MKTVGLVSFVACVYVVLSAGVQKRTKHEKEMDARMQSNPPTYLMDHQIKPLGLCVYLGKPSDYALMAPYIEAAEDVEAPITVYSHEKSMANLIPPDSTFILVEYLPNATVLEELDALYKQYLDAPRPLQALARLYYRYMHHHAFEDSYHALKTHSMHAALSTPPSCTVMLITDDHPAAAIASLQSSLPTIVVASHPGQGSLPLNSAALPPRQHASDADSRSLTMQFVEFLVSPVAFLADMVAGAIAYDHATSFNAPLWAHPQALPVPSWAFRQAIPSGVVPLGLIPMPESKRMAASIAWLYPFSTLLYPQEELAEAELAESMSAHPEHAVVVIAVSPDTLQDPKKYDLVCAAAIRAEDQLKRGSQKGGHVIWASGAPLSKRRSDGTPNCGTIEMAVHVGPFEWIADNRTIAVITDGDLAVVGAALAAGTFVITLDFDHTKTYPVAYGVADAHMGIVADPYLPMAASFVSSYVHNIASRPYTTSSFNHTVALSQSFGGGATALASLLTHAAGVRFMTVPSVWQVPFAQFFEAVVAQSHMKYAVFGTAFVLCLMPLFFVLAIIYHACCHSKPAPKLTPQQQQQRFQAYVQQYVQQQQAAAAAAKGAGTATPETTGAGAKDGVRQRKTAKKHAE